MPISVPIPILKARGHAQRVPTRFDAQVRVPFDDGWHSDNATDEESVAPPATEFRWETPRSAITRNTSPDIGFNLGLNPYRGCEHVMEPENLRSCRQ